MGARKIRVENKPKSLVVEKVSFFDLARIWMERNVRALAAAAVGALVLVLAAWGFQTYTENKEAKAREAYAVVMKEWPQGGAPTSEDWSEYIAAAEQYLARYSGVSIASDVRLDLSRACYAKGKYEEAYKWGKEGLNGISQHSPAKSMALYQLALTCKQLGKQDESLGYLQTLKAMAPAGIERELNWQMARIYAGKNDSAKALEYYELALKAGGAYPSEAMIKEDLAAVKSKSDTQAARGEKGNS